MTSSVPRRDFLKLSATAAATPLAATLVQTSTAAAPKPVPGADKLTVYQVEQGSRQVWVRWANHLVTSYRAHPTQKYPYLYPLAGPISGLSLTTETSLPYPHHRSLLFACDHVNGGNYWQGTLASGQVLSTGPSLGESTETTAVIFDKCEWRKPGEPVACRDERKITVTVAHEKLRYVDFEITWIAEQDVTVTKTNHSLFAIRASLDLTPWGGGTLLNSQGDSGEEATFGREAAWCGYHGRRHGIPDELIEGIAIFDHPENPWSPCTWFTRDYGFISPTPLYFLTEPWQLPAGESVRLRYRVVLHAGDPRQAELDRLFQAWVAG